MTQGQALTPPRISCCRKILYQDRAYLKPRADNEIKRRPQNAVHAPPRGRGLHWPATTEAASVRPTGEQLQEPRSPGCLRCKSSQLSHALTRYSNHWQRCRHSPLTRAILKLLTHCFTSVGAHCHQFSDFLGVF